MARERIFFARYSCVVCELARVRSFVPAPAYTRALSPGRLCGSKCTLIVQCSVSFLLAISTQLHRQQPVLAAVLMAELAFAAVPPRTEVACIGVSKQSPSVQHLTAYFSTHVRRRFERLMNTSAGWSRWRTGSYRLQNNVTRVQLMFTFVTMHRSTRYACPRSSRRLCGVSKTSCLGKNPQTLHMLFGRSGRHVLGEWVASDRHPPPATVRRKLRWTERVAKEAGAAAAFELMRRSSRIRPDSLADQQLGGGSTHLLVLSARPGGRLTMGNDTHATAWRK